MADEDGIRKPNTGKPEGDSGKAEAPRSLPAQKEEGRKEPSRQDPSKQEPLKKEHPKQEPSKKETDGEEDEELERSEKKESSTASFQMPAALKVLSKLSVKAYLGLIVLLLLVIVSLLFCFHKNFRVQEIYVSGNQKISTEAILSASGIKENDHLLHHVSGSVMEKLKLKYGEAERKIEESDPYISSAKVYPKYPGQVYIEVTERRKVAYVAIPDGYAIIADDSVVLDILEGDVPEGIPEIRGLPILSAQIGKELELSSKDGYEICVTILGAILGAEAGNDTQQEEFDFLSHVICIRYCENMTTYVDLSIPNVDHVISIKIGGLNTISDDMNWLRYAVVSGYFEGKEGTVLDMTGKDYILR